MKTADLCPQDELAPILVMYEDIRSNPHAALNLPPEESLPEDFCLDLEDAKRVCESVWAYLGVSLPSPVEFVWNTKKTGYLGRAERERAEPIYLEAQRSAEEYKRLRRTGALTAADLARFKEQQVRFAEWEKLKSAPVYAFRMLLSKNVFKSVPASERLKTVIHEACHIACFLLYPDEDVGHGPKWADLMVRCEVSPDVKSKYGAPDRHPIATCPKCGARSQLQTKTVNMLKAMKGYAVCVQNGCGTIMTIAHVEFPEKKRAAR